MFCTMSPRGFTCCSKVGSRPFESAIPFTIAVGRPRFAVLSCFSVTTLPSLNRGGRHHVVPDLEDVAGLDLGEVDGVAPDVVGVGPYGAEVVGRASASLLQRRLAQIPALAASDLVAELSTRPDHDLLIGGE
jgi:hypothetical protein